MRIIEPGHKYELDLLDQYKDSTPETLSFVNRINGQCHTGTNNQEVLRVLLNRVKFLEKELHWDGNEKILFHLRMALVLHESRHLERLVERNCLNPENVITEDNGHFAIKGLY